MKNTLTFCTPCLSIQDPDLDAFASVLSHTNGISNFLTSYSTLQAFLIIGLIIKLLFEWSFQARLSLIYLTLHRSFEPLYHLVIVILIMVPMVAVMANILIGERLADVSEITGALQDTFLALLGASSVQDHNIWSLGSINTLQLAPMEVFGDVILLLTEVILVMHILLTFFLCIVMQVREERGGMSMLAACMVKSFGRIV